MYGTPRTVSEVMTQTVVSIGRNASFKEIVETMRIWNVSALPVLGGDERVLGVVSEADLMPKEEFRDDDDGPFVTFSRVDALAKARGVTAEEVMTSPAITVRAGATIAHAARTMALRNVKRLPVVDAHEHLTGVISRSDVLKVFLRPDEDIADDVRTEVISRILPGAEPPVRVRVRDGVVTLTGHVANTELVPLLARQARAVEGVVDVALEDSLTGAGRP